jgi:hypothetical protein
LLDLGPGKGPWLPVVWDRVDDCSTLYSPRFIDRIWYDAVPVQGGESGSTGYITGGAVILRSTHSGVPSLAVSMVPGTLRTAALY